MNRSRSTVTRTVATLLLLAPAAALCSAGQDEGVDPLRIEIREIPSQRTLLRDVRGSYDQQPQVIQEIFTYAGMNGINPTGGLIGLYPDDPAATPAEELRWQIAIIVNDDLEMDVEDPYRLETLPAIRAAVYQSTVGSIDADGASAAAWLREQGNIQAGPVRMAFTGMHADPQKMPVEVMIPLRESASRTEGGQAQQPQVSLEAMRFLAGEWVGEAEGNRFIENWSAPMGDAMMGAFQWVRGDGATWMYELMTIRRETQRIVLYMRHFEADLTPWERDEPMMFELAEVSDDRAVFRRIGGPSVAEERLIFAREQEALQIELHERGEVQRFEFRLRSPPGAAPDGEQGGAGED